MIGPLAGGADTRARTLPIEVNQASGDGARLVRGRVEAPPPAVFARDGGCGQRILLSITIVIALAASKDAPLPLEARKAALDWPRVDDCALHAVTVDKLECEAALAASDVQDAGTAAQLVDAIGIEQPPTEDTRALLILDPSPGLEARDGLCLRQRAASGLQRLEIRDCS